MLQRLRNTVLILSTLGLTLTAAPILAVPPDKSVPRTTTKDSRNETVAERNSRLKARAESLKREAALKKFNDIRREVRRSQEKSDEFIEKLLKPDEYLLFMKLCEQAREQGREHERAFMINLLPARLNTQMVLIGGSLAGSK